MTSDEPRDDAVRVVIAGGGTGGHLTPALSLARELTRRVPATRVLLVGGRRGPDRELLPASGLPYRLLSAPAVERRRWWRNAVLPVTLPRAIAAGWFVVGQFRPHVAVGTGGYVSVPVGMAAGLRGIPLLLLEQNRTPGLATRLLARWARRICVQFPETVDALAGRAPVEVTGSPIDPPDPAPADFAARLEAGWPVVGVFGGSQGARSVNELILGLYGTDPASAPNLIWQTGRADEERVRAAGPWPERVVIRAFFAPMAAIYPRLDVIVCRAGAMTLAEITAWGIPSILIPYPHATDDHQAANARALEEAGAAFTLVEAEATPRRLGDLLKELLDGAGERRARMAAAARRLGRPDATSTVADRVLDLAGAAVAESGTAGGRQ